ncbi:unnamed protein product, partial [Coregonus sp. 'balchen']
MASKACSFTLPQVSTDEVLKALPEDKKQFTFINGAYSEPRAINCGVPQGSCLGPLMYLLYTNDLPLVLFNSMATMSADKTTVYVTGNSVGHMKYALEDDMI